MSVACAPCARTPPVHAPRAGVPSTAGAAGRRSPDELRRRLRATVRMIPAAELRPDDYLPGEDNTERWTIIDVKVLGRDVLVTVRWSGGRTTLRTYPAHRLVPVVRPD